jgi:hemolysin III
MAIQLYDGRRDVLYDKPRLRGWLHLWSFAAALVVGPLLLVSEHGMKDRLVACVYACCVAGLFGASALYHRGRWGERAARRLQRLDHTMIILMIAGTATPALALSMPTSLRLPALLSLWCLAGVVIGVRLVWMNAPERLAGTLYVGLGWIAGAAIPAVWIHNGVAPALLLVVGGLLYTTGAICYHRRALDFVSSVFGYHESFHTYVTLGAACQFVALTAFVI